MEKPWRECKPKVSPKPLFKFGNNPKQALHARNSFKNKGKEGREKNTKKKISRAKRALKMK